MSAALASRPFTLAGFPLRAWAFGGRTWAAVVLALYVAFWLELESPATAALTVAVLAFPARGQGMEKAVFRVVATVLGLVAAIVITGAFTQTGWLLIAVFALWIGIWVYVSSLFDGFRSYAALLCIITVCLIAVEQIDTPQRVFDLGMQRGGAIVIGILATALVNDLLSAPDYYPVIGARLEALRARIWASTWCGAGTSLAPAAVAALLREITALRPEITTLATESSIGSLRSAAARTAMVELVFALAASRLVVALRGCGAAVRHLDWMAAEYRRRDGHVMSSLAALRDGTAPERPWRALFYRSHRIAAENGVRAAVYFALGAAALSLGEWPAASISLAFVGILIGLSAMSPDQNAASVLMLAAVPIGCTLAGMLEFVVLDGVTAFPLLALGLLPFVVVPCLLMTIPSPALVSLGRSNLIFTLAIFSPSNPQTYDPEAFLFACMFLSAAALILFVCQHVLPPLSGRRRVEVLLAEARRDLAGMTRQRRPSPSRQEAMFRDAVRVGQMVAAAGRDPAAAAAIDQAIACFDRAAALRLANAALDMLRPDIVPPSALKAAAAAVADADGQAMLAAAETLVADRIGGTHDDAATALAIAGLLLGGGHRA